MSVNVDEDTCRHVVYQNTSCSFTFLELAIKKKKKERKLNWKSFVLDVIPGGLHRYTTLTGLALDNTGLK